MSKMNKNIDMELTVKRVKKILKKKNVEMNQLKEKLNSPDFIDKWFNGQYIPSLNDLLELSKVLDVPMDQILVRKNESSNSEYKIVITEHELPAEDFKRMGYLALRYNIPFQDLIEIYNRGFKFYEASALFDEDVENEYLN